MRQLAWLRATPKESPKSRLQGYLDQDKDIPLPPLDEEAYYLVKMLDEIGAITQNGMGIAPLSWQELNSWREASEMILTYWELCTLKELSYEYAAELSMASDSDKRPPYLAPEASLVVPDLDSRLKNAFAAFNMRDKKKDDEE